MLKLQRELEDARLENQRLLDKVYLLLVTLCRLPTSRLQVRQLEQEMARMNEVFVTLTTVDDFLNLLDRSANVRLQTGPLL
jgi:hypothetical protein